MDGFDYTRTIPLDGNAYLADLKRYDFVNEKTKKKIDELIEAEMLLLNGLEQYDLLLTTSCMTFKDFADERLKESSDTNYFSLDRMLQSLVDSRLELMRYLKDAINSYGIPTKENFQADPSDIRHIISNMAISAVS
jgi:hypothetical protein